ncbi:MULTISPECIES: lysophospholipid acyltransferase family protein [Streptomyces]|uniref:lysophospholipid acyltransferase family protein n=1 Tax=Streptomyces TaxID=1883 RepID=UPI0035711F72
MPRAVTSAWLPSAPCTPQDCVRSAGTHAGPVRAVMRLAAAAVLLVAGIVALALLTPAGRLPQSARDRAVRAWCRALVRALGVRVRTTGAAPRPPGGLLLVANHVSWLDVPLLAAVRPARMLAKTEVRHWPVAGPLAARAGTLFIDRDRLRALPGTVARIADVLRAGGAVTVFPEGSTWCGRARGRFRRAAFQAALDASVPVQPVRLRYRLAGHAGVSTAPAFVGDDTLLASLWRVASARRLTAEVRVLPVLRHGTAPDRRTLARLAEEAVRGDGTGVADTHP